MNPAGGRLDSGVLQHAAPSLLKELKICEICVQLVEEAFLESSEEELTGMRRRRCPHVYCLQCRVKAHDIHSHLHRKIWELGDCPACRGIPHGLSWEDISARAGLSEPESGGGSSVAQTLLPGMHERAHIKQLTSELQPEPQPDSGRGDHTQKNKAAALGTLGDLGHPPVAKPRMPSGAAGSAVNKLDQRCGSRT